jgi:lysozyme
MKPRHQVSRAGVVLIKRFEGMRAKAAQLEDGRWTIGYGHTKTARADAAVSEADAEALLLYDLINVAHAVNEWVLAPLNQHQFDALVSFAFNIGLENFRRSTTLRRLNEGRPLEAALAMELWRRADVDGERIVVDALVRRRAYEKTLFLKPTDYWVPAPSPVLPPKLDYDAGALTPSSIPQVLLAPMDGDRAIALRATPLVPLEDAGPSASELAAASVTARLESILPDDHLAGDPEPAPQAAEPALETAEPAEELPFPEGDQEEAPRDLDMPAVADPQPEPETVTLAEIAQDPAGEPLTIDKAPKPKPEPVGPLMLAGLAFLGIVLFGAAVRYGFSQPVGGAIPLTQQLVGWVAGGLGVGCFAAAAYFGLIRLGDSD